MNMNFFTEQHGFQKNLIDPSSNLGAKKDYTTSLKKNEFNTSRSAQNDVNTSDRNKKFAEMMNALKKKESADQNKEKTDNASKDSENAKDIRSNIEINDARISVFQTQRSDLQTNDNIAIELNNIEVGSTIEHIETSLANIAALNEEIQRLIEEQTQNATTENQIIVTSEAEPEKIESILAILAAFLSNEDENTKTAESETNTDIELVSILEKIEDAVKSDDAAAITSGISPEQLTQLQEDIQKYINNELDKQDTAALEALAAQFVALTPPVKNEKIAGDKVGATEKATLQIIPEKSQSPILPKEHHAQERYETRYDARYDNGKNPETAKIDLSDKSDFKAAIKNAETLTNPMSANNDNAKTAAKQLLQTSAMVQNTGIAIETTTGQNTALTGVQNIQSPLQNSVTNVITQSQNAGAQHPATQMVSVTIQKAVKAGENTNIKLKLDPPELGRVEVKMSIDKDNSTKIVLTIEKPETYMLLKQDADSLQRALNNAGLDTNGNLSFELASEDNNFGNESRQGNAQGQNEKSANSNGAEDNLIETTMDWQVDPETGQMRYNALI